MDTLLILLAGAAFVIAILAQSQAHRVGGDLAALRKRLAEVETELRRLRDGPLPMPEPEPEPVAEPEPEITVAQVETPPPPPPARPAVEQVLTERWLVWLGGLALALGGAFLVKMSVDLGLLGPAVRVSLGGLGGAGLMMLGHALRRRDLPGQVPQSLVAAGAAMLFASLFAAHGLYGLIGPLPTFAALAAVAAVTALLAVGHGPFVGLLGLAGAFAVPALVHAAEPDAIGLFGYLLVIAAGMLALLRWCRWWWLAWAVLIAAAGWTGVWLIDPFQPGDERVLGGFLLVLSLLFALFRLGVPGVAALALPVEAPMVPRVVWAAHGIIAALLGLVVLAADHSAVAQGMLALFVLGSMAFGRRDATFDRLPWLAAAVVVLIVVAWQAPEPGDLAVLAGGMAALVGVGGVVLLKKGRRRWRWAALAAGAPVALMAAAYARLPDALPEWGWTALALVLAGLNLAAAARVAARRHWLGMEAALAGFAIGVVAALALAATMALEQAWLSVALALMVPGIAWVAWHTSITGLRRVALLVAAAVLARLALNPQIIEYPLGAGPFNWLLYGYGVPALAFWLAARRFRRIAADSLVAVLDGGAILCVMLLVSLQIHHLMAGGLDVARPPALAEISLHTIAWLAAAALLCVVHHRGGGAVPLWAARVLALLGTVSAVGLQAALLNPLWNATDAGIALLLLAYAAPALLYAVLWRVMPVEPGWGERAAAGLAIVFAFLWLSLQVRHAFAGPRLHLGGVEPAEMWTYSVAWLAGGLALLGGGIARGTTALRRAGLAVVLLVVAKVFVLDLSHLTGLWRALSFLALGGVLVAIGGLYRRFVRVG